MRQVLLVAAIAAIAFGGITLVALEGNEVVVLVTVDAAGGRRETRAWIAEEDGAFWIEAAHPERGFYEDILAGSGVDIEGGDRRRSYRALPAENPHGHEKIRALLRAKYGWADTWIGMLADTSRSIGIRLVEIDGSPASG